MAEMVSVIAPAYNHEKYVRQALESVALQSYLEKELIVIDDCSKDDTPSVIESYLNSGIKDRFPGGITFIRHKKNMNAHNSLNEGIKKAKGKYISVINTDDLYEKNRLEVIIGEMKQKRARFAFSNVKIINENDEIKDYSSFVKMISEIKRLPTCSLALAVENGSISTGNYIFEKSLWDELGGFDTQYHFIHDWDFILKTCLVTEPLFVENTDYIYRFHETNTLKQIDESQEQSQKKDREVYNVLHHYLSNIISHKCKNTQLPSTETWDYFFKWIRPCYAANIWTEILEKEEIELS